MRVCMSPAHAAKCRLLDGPVMDVCNMRRTRQAPLQAAQRLQLACTPSPLILLARFHSGGASTPMYSDTVWGGPAGCGGGCCCTGTGLGPCGAGPELGLPCTG